MRISYKLSIILVASVLLYSCSDFLDIIPDDVATVETAFENRQNAESFLFTCYSYLPDPSDPWTYPAYSIDEFHFHTPERTSMGTAQEMYKIIDGYQNVNQTYLDFWGGTGGKVVKNLFQGIRDCNIFLENIDHPKDMQSEEERVRWIAEVKFIKAYLHFFMMQVYGPVPIVKTNIPVSGGIDEVRIYREPIDSVASYVIQLLDEAVPGLPVQITDVKNEFRRITKPIAMAVKAKVLATIASPLYNGGVADYSGYTDSRGKQLISTTYDPQKWVEAANAIKEAIVVCESNGNRLMDTTDIDSYNQLSTRSKYKILLRDIISKSGDQGLADNPEVVWAINQGTNSGRKGNYLEDYYYGCIEFLCYPGASHWSGYAGATMNTVKMFYTDKGIPIKEDQDWLGADYSEIVTVPGSSKDYLPAGEVTAKLNLNREPRFYADLGFNRGYLTMKNYETSPHILRTLGGEKIGKRNYTGYNAIKLTSYTASGLPDDMFYPADYQFPLIRMADLYLLYAEALNEVKTTPDDEVYQLIDKVRNRAGLKGVLESWQHSVNPGKPATKEGMREIIRTERQIELMYEGQRFFDLRRWYVAETYMNGPVTGWQVFGTTPENYYKETILFNRNYKLRDYFWPIRESDLLINPNLVQSYGW
ncbi:MAG: RagB/SusD family nutrient uptake outer membrane protein [Prolixibacteraceae bacterium]